MIAVIDYGAGNVFNVIKACNYLGKKAVLTADSRVISQAESILFPGVGAFGTAMEKLRSTGLDRVIKQQVADGTPFLGICLGMQLLFDSSDEFGKTLGLGLIPGKVVKIPDDGQRLVPQIGWNQNELRAADSIFKEVAGQYAYFVHSYYVKCDPRYVVSSVDYGVKVPAIVQRDNVYGFQFHPEKSGQAGLQLLETFFEKVVS